MKQQFRAHFRALTVVQIVLLVGTISLLSWLLVTGDLFAVPVVVGIIVAMQVIGLIRYVESHVDTLEDFFAAINYEDFTRRFVEEDVDAELKGAFNRVLGKFQDASAQREVQAVYLETVVKHVPVPFIAERSNGSLSLVNNPARRLTGISALQELSQLGELDSRLPDLMRNIDAGSQQLLQTKIREIPVELRVSVSEIRFGGDVERLYSIENLSGELTARESSAWRNLIRVLTHEIMNTLTPVASLAQTAALLSDQPGTTDDIREAVTTIGRRSEGLMKFVSRYRELLKVPEPEPETIRVLGALEGVVLLMTSELDSVDVTVSVVPESLEIQADRQLLDQVLVNLVKNAIDAVSDVESPRIWLSAKLDLGRALIKIRDNGSGIESDALDHVFVPFFTTKRDGSGIGLSLCRHVMIAHHGEIVIESDDSGTTVVLLF